MSLVKFLAVSCLFFTTIHGSALAQPFTPSSPDLIRWTGSEDQDASLTHILAVFAAKTGMTFKESDFSLQEDRDLAFNHYQRYEQLVNGIVVDGKAIRVWTTLADHKTVQIEAMLESPAKVSTLRTHGIARLSEQETTQMAIASVRESGNDARVRGIDWKDSWINGELVRTVTIKGKHGKHKILISHRRHQIFDRSYEEFPNADASDSISLNALIFPVYEEVASSGKILPRQPAVLKNINLTMPVVAGDIYAAMRAQKYFDTNFSPVLGETAEGRAKGYWSMTFLKNQAAQIRSSLPQIDNSFANGMMLQGKYATINIYSEAFTKFQGINFTPRASAAFFPNWIDGDPSEMIPGNAFYGKPLFSAEEALNRVARRLPDHDPATYLNDGFDEIQVYYAINTLVESLQSMGFQDPELSTRAFNAFLYDPDVGYRDNAFYTDDTINFTTYSPDAPNYARDNSTIWHELGHGVMDRLMGDNIRLADTGGLSEGMADFVAALVIQSVTQGIPFPGSDEFRIINKTGFNLTNEVHDDGEAYGGTMKDFLDASIKKFGQRQGLHMVTDLILETMRLTRDYPGLVANDWFNHILFADSLGREGVRAPGAMKDLLIAALDSRNFHLDGTPTASFTLKNTDSQIEVAGNAVGTRNKPNQLKIAKDAQANFHVSVSLKSTKDYQFQYPVQVKVAFNGGPLEGAAHWVGEENGPAVYTLNSEADIAQIPLTVTGTCDAINREDGSCVDFAYVQIFNHGATEHPAAKKRFYVQIRNP